MIFDALEPEPPRKSLSEHNKIHPTSDLHFVLKLENVLSPVAVPFQNYNSAARMHAGPVVRFSRLSQLPYLFIIADLKIVPSMKVFLASISVMRPKSNASFIKILDTWFVPSFVFLADFWSIC